MSRPVPTGLRIFAAIAIVFGLLSLVSGGRALFGGADPGDAVPFVLWFNFLTGALYVLAGAAIYSGRPWGTWLAWLLAAALVIVFAAFGLHILAGGAFEMRTVGAMTLRTAFWIALAAVLGRPGAAERPARGGGTP